MCKVSEKYIKLLIAACNTIKFDYYPQIEASDLLYRRISLEDIYLPLSLVASPSPSVIQKPSSILTFEELIQEIDRKFELLKSELEIDEKKDVSLISGSSESDTDVLDDSIIDFENNISHKSNHLLIQGNPGSGKTTLCKRLVLAILNNESGFFEKYEKENDLHFNTNDFPVLIDCRNILDLTKEELSSSTFITILYKLCVQKYGTLFLEISLCEFTELINTHVNENLLIILDGWDEIVDSEKADIFCDQFNDFIEKHSKINSIITIRLTYLQPQLVFPYSGNFAIKGLSDKDIHAFCENWSKVVLSSNSSRVRLYPSISEQIIKSKEPQIIEMRENPLDLSLLLTVSKTDGCLPDNRAELFEKLVDLYIFWNSIKNTGDLSPKSIRVFLAYIASIFTKRNILVCKYEELQEIIKQAAIDLESTFKEDISLLKPDNIIKELEHTGVLKRTYGGKGFSFSESNALGNHRQMQEYLTAYAILLQYSDEEYNSMTPLDIFEDKYVQNSWREVIVFAVLIDNARICQRIIQRLIDKSNEGLESSYLYNDLLFEFIVSGANVRNKEQIYDICFKDYISSQSIDDISILVSSTNKNSSKFINYIKTMFSNSLEIGEPEYMYANAIIEVAVNLQMGKTPTSLGRELLKSGDNYKVITGLFIFILLSWCKYTELNNIFTPYYSKYKMEPDIICFLKTLLKDSQYNKYVIKTINEIIAAQFADFESFFSEEEIKTAFQHIQNNESTENYCQLIYMAPIFDPSFKRIEIEAAEIKDSIINDFENAIKINNSEEIVFRFCICVATGCWDSKEIEEKWNLVDCIYKNINNEVNLGTVRYKQLKGYKKQKEIAKLFKIISSTVLSLPDCFTDYNSPIWTIYDKEYSYLTYSNGENLIKLTHGQNKLSQEAEDFLDNTLYNSIVMHNNLAYLLRRKELTSIDFISSSTANITPDELLKKGVLEIESFSIINYALYISGIFVNTYGNYKVGKGFLYSIRDALIPNISFWKDVIGWWLQLAIDKKEYEGFVVLTWLYELGIIMPVNLERQQINRLLSQFSCLSGVYEEDIIRFMSELEKAITNNEAEDTQFFPVASLIQPIEYKRENIVPIEKEDI